GNMYCAYNDKVTAADPDKSNIYLVQSTDGGATWSARTQVNDDGTTTDQWQPNVVVSPAGDRIGVFYYSRQGDAGNNLFKYYGRIGAIVGPAITFSPSAAVSDTASFPEFGRDAVINATYMGDYDQAYARVGGTFDVLWAANRSDLPSCAPRKDPNVYYQCISAGIGTPTPTATPTASPTPTATATPTPCDSGIIVNGGFETGSFPPWIVDNSNPAPFVASSGSGYPVHTGMFSGHVGSLPGGETPGDSSFYQTITVPAGG